jgi:hypothetical protein
MKAGRIFFYVLRLLGYRKIRFEVETPSSVAAVRGTKFGLHVYEDKGPETAEKRVFTDCYCETGLIEIDGMLVEPGELYMSATGAVRTAPPEYSDQFHAALALPAPPPPSVPASTENRTDEENRIQADDQAGAATAFSKKARGSWSMTQKCFHASVPTMWTPGLPWTIIWPMPSPIITTTTLQKL